MLLRKSRVFISKLLLAPIKLPGSRSVHVFSTYYLPRAEILFPACWECDSPRNVASYSESSRNTLNDISLPCVRARWETLAAVVAFCATRYGITRCHVLVVPSLNDAVSGFLPTHRADDRNPSRE